MKVITKDAAVTAPKDDEFPGTFEAILSAPTKDRDGETLLPEEWKQPLPDHITVDIDHQMTVAGTIGSAKPWIDEKGNLRISGTFASTTKAQEVRTLMQEGHINRTSVAFMSERTKKDGVTTVTREVLNAAIVAIPANREAVVLSAKGLKAGARNSQSDLEHIQAIHDHAVALGADTGTADAKSYRPAGTVEKAVAGSYEQRQRAVYDALDVAYRTDQDGKYVYAYPTATFDTTVVYRVSGDTDQVGQWQADYTLNDDGTVTLGTPARVNLVEQIVPLGGTTETAGSADSGFAAADATSAAADTKTADTDVLELQARAARLRLYSTEAAL